MTSALLAIGEFLGWEWLIDKALNKWVRDIHKRHPL